MPGFGSEFHRPTPGTIEIVFQAYVSGGSGDYTVSYPNGNPVSITLPANPSSDETTASAHALDNITGQTGDSGGYIYFGHCP